MYINNTMLQIIRTEQAEKVDVESVKANDLNNFQSVSLLCFKALNPHSKFIVLRPFSSWLCPCLVIKQK